MCRYIHKKINVKIFDVSIFFLTGDKESKKSKTNMNTKRYDVVNNDSMCRKKRV